MSYFFLALNMVYPKTSFSDPASVHFQTLLRLYLQLFKTFSFSFCRSASISAVQFRYCSAYICSNFPFSASAVSLSVSAVQLRTLPFLPDFSKSLNVSFCCSVSAIQFQILLCLHNFSKSCQVQFLLFNLRFCCFHSSSNFHYQFLLFSSRHCSAYTILQDLSALALLFKFQPLLLKFRYCSAHIDILDLSVSVSISAIPFQLLF